MAEHEAREDIDALVRIRTHLTVALLAIARLCRRFGSFPPVERLCGLAKDALLGVRDEVAGIEARIWRRAGHPERVADATDERSAAP